MCSFDKRKAPCFVLTIATILDRYDSLCRIAHKSKDTQGDRKMIKIHIRRNIPEDKKEDAMLLIIKLRSMSMGKPGYISGETLKRLDKPGESLVVTKWQSVHYWNQWFQSEERSEIQNKIVKLIGEETQYEIYEYDPM